MMDELYYVPNNEMGDKSDFSINSTAWHDYNEYENEVISMPRYHATISGSFHSSVTSSLKKTAEGNNRKGRTVAVIM